MERKYKISEFATILGITPKTVYRMIDRNEIKTVTELVNHRQTKLVVTTDEQIEELKHAYSQYTGYTGNCEDILTDSNENMTSNNGSQLNNDIISASEMVEKIISINDTYNERINALNEELIDSKSKLLLLEDKANREGMYINEINTLKNDNKELMKSRQTVFNVSMIVIVLLSLVIISMCMFNVVSNNVNSEKTSGNIQNVQKIEQPAPEQIKTTKKTRK